MKFEDGAWMTNKNPQMYISISPWALQMLQDVVQTKIECIIH